MLQHSRLVHVSAVRVHQLVHGVGAAIECCQVYRRTAVRIPAVYFRHRSVTAQFLQYHLHIYAAVACAAGRACVMPPVPHRRLLQLVAGHVVHGVEPAEADWRRLRSQAWRSSGSSRLLHVTDTHTWAADTTPDFATGADLAQELTRLSEVEQPDLIVINNFTTFFSAYWRRCSLELLFTEQVFILRHQTIVIMNLRKCEQLSLSHI